MAPGHREPCPAAKVLLILVGDSSRPAAILLVTIIYILPLGPLHPRTLGIARFPLLDIMVSRDIFNPPVYVGAHRKGDLRGVLVLAAERHNHLILHASSASTDCCCSESDLDVIGGWWLAFQAP